MNCTNCGKELSGEEIQYPHFQNSNSTGIICDTCEEDLFSFPCAICGHWANEATGKSRSWVVFEEVDGIPPGIYADIQRPRCVVFLFGTWFCKDNIRRIGSLTPFTDYFFKGEYACGDACTDCLPNERAA